MITDLNTENEAQALSNRLSAQNTRTAKLYIQDPAKLFSREEVISRAVQSMRNDDEKGNMILQRLINQLRNS